MSQKKHIVPPGQIITVDGVQYRAGDELPGAPEPEKKKPAKKAEKDKN